MDNALEAIDEFNTCIKFLARAYCSKKRGTFEEEKSLRTNKRLYLLIAADPAIVIKTCGPFFLKYADSIQKRDFEEIMKLDFDEEKKAYGKSEDGANHDSKSMDGKIKFIKNVFRSASPEEKEELIEKINTLLSSYCKYALAIKSLK